VQQGQARGEGMLVWNHPGEREINRNINTFAYIKILRNEI
jgi:hypothetical protein